MNIKNKLLWLCLFFSLQVLSQSDKKVVEKKRMTSNELSDTTVFLTSKIADLDNKILVLNKKINNKDSINNVLRTENIKLVNQIKSLKKRDIDWLDK